MQSIRSLESRAKKFLPVIEKAKSQVSDVQWYPYQTYQFFNTLRKLQYDHDFEEILSGGPVVDVGCGDGLMSFFLEQEFGCEVHAINHARTNYNRMSGVKALKAALNSGVKIIEADVDEDFSIYERYGLALLVGVLYHLKNPMGLLSVLARHSRRCLLSTRIAQVTPGGAIEFAQFPLAYLAEQRETNRDETNFWFFSETALLRILRRTGWEVLDSCHTGCLAGSDPVSQEKDERMHCLLQSCLPSAWYTVERLSGFHEEEETGGWCWTARRFRFLIQNIHGRPQALQFEFRIAEAFIAKLSSVSVQCSINGVESATLVCSVPGTHTIEAKIPENALGEQQLELEVQLDRALEFGHDRRELGVIVSALDSDSNVRVVI